MCVVQEGRKEGMLVLVVVGSTSFDALVGAAVEGEVLQLLAEVGAVEVTLQVGRGAPPHHLNPALTRVEGDGQVSPLHKNESN